MKRHLRKSEFSLAKAVQENWSVYVCIPPSRLARFSRWTRALVQVAFAAKMDERHTHKGERNLFILDEFAALGKVQPIEESMAYMAGYGIKLCPIIQNLGQVKEHYPKNWETFFSNSGVVIAWGLNDLESLKYVSDRMGNVMAWETSYSSGQNQQGGLLRRITGYSDNRSTALHERPVRRVNEIHEDGSREGRLNQDGTRDAPRSFILPASSAPFIVQRVNYFDDPNHAGLYDSEDDIRAWEEKHGGKI
jgi:type IV secretion system protein VirD4